MTSLVARVDNELVAAVDELVAQGLVPSRSAAVRIALERLVDRYRRQGVGQQIVDGYRANPQTDGEVGWADEATARMIADESW